MNGWISETREAGREGMARGEDGRVLAQEWGQGWGRVWEVVKCLLSEDLAGKPSELS